MNSLEKNKLAFLRNLTRESFQIGTNGSSEEKKPSLTLLCNCAPKCTHTYIPVCYFC